MRCGKQLSSHWPAAANAGKRVYNADIENGQLCAKGRQNCASLPSQRKALEKLNERRVKSSLLDLKKVRCAPVLSLESNARFNSRLWRFSRKQMTIDPGDTLYSEENQRPSSPLSLLMRSRCN